MSIAQEILANDELMDRLAKEYAQVVSSYYGNGKRGTDSEAKRDMAYILNQEEGFCLSPDALGKHLSKIWDKIQARAKEKYGYRGPISEPKKENMPEYLISKAEKIRSSEKVMRDLGERWYRFQRNKDKLVRNPMMSKSYYGSYPNTILEWAPELGLNIFFEEAVLIARYLKRDIQRYGEMVRDEEESKKDRLMEAVYKKVLKKLRQNG